MKCFFLALVCLMPLPGLAQLPPPQRPQELPLREEEAKDIVEGLFGCQILSETDEQTRLDYSEGLACPRSTNELCFPFIISRCSTRCPLARVRGTKCNDFKWVPSSIGVYRTSFVAPVSGHLARNRLVLVTMYSNTQAFQVATIHGILVFPGEEADPKSKPAFIWYVSRLGSPASLKFFDVDQDGVLDILYTWSMTLLGGVEVVVRDIWKARDLRPVAFLSSGEYTPGLLLGSFAGVPLHSSSFFDFIVRGAWHWVSVGEGRMPLLIIENGEVITAHADQSWGIIVVGDLGEGVKPLLIGGPKPEENLEAESKDLEEGSEETKEEEPTCAPVELPPGAPFEVRRVLLEIEKVCRYTREVPRVEGEDTLPPVEWLLLALRWTLAWLSLNQHGLSGASLTFENAAAIGYARAFGARFPLGPAIAFHAAWRSYRLFSESFDKKFTWYLPKFSEEVRWFPLAAPMWIPVWAFLRGVEEVGGWLLGGQARDKREDMTEKIMDAFWKVIY